MTVAEIKAFFIVGIAVGSAIGANQSAMAGDTRAEDMANEQVDDSAYIQKLSHDAQASRGLLSTRRTTRYASEVCVENAASVYISYKTKDTTTGKQMKKWTNWYGFSSTETKCSSLSGASAGDTVELKIRAESSSQKNSYYFVYYANADSAKIKVTGDLVGWETACDSCETTPPDCEDPTVSDISNYNVTYDLEISQNLSKTCRNEADDDLAVQECEAEFQWTQSQTQTVTITDGFSITEGVTVSLSKNWVVSGVTAGITASVSVTESFTQATATAISVTYTADSMCTQTVEPGKCLEITSTFRGGYLSGDWKGTLTCSNGLTESVGGTMSFTNAYSTSATEGCLTTHCADDGDSDISDYYDISPSEDYDSSSDGN